MPARIGLALDPLDTLYRWRTKAKTAGMEPWYLAAEAVSREAGREGTQKRNLSVSALEAKATEFGSTVKTNPFNSGRNAADWTRDDIGLDYEISNSLTHQFTQARLYTFLMYRRGLAQALAQVPYTAERAVHAYVRIALTWVERWPGLTRATMFEQAREHDELRQLRQLGGGVRLSSAQLYEATFALPTILESDIADLLAADGQEREREDRPRSARAKHNGVTIVPAVQLVGKIRLAAIAMIEDPTLRILSAYNTMREDANDELGGALARARLSYGDFDLAARDKELLAEISSHTWATRPPEEREELLRARPAWRTAFGNSNAEEDPE